MNVICDRFNDYTILLTEMSLGVLFQETGLNGTRGQFNGTHQINHVGFQHIKGVFTAVSKGKLGSFSSFTCVQIMLDIIFCFRNVEKK